MTKIMLKAERELFGHSHPSEEEIRMHRLGYILTNGHSPQQKHRAYLELRRRVEENKDGILSHSLGHYRRVIGLYRP